MATGDSYRGQSNLHIYFAEQYLQQSGEADAEAWSGYLRRASLESAVWQLQLAYQAHLADLIVQQPRFSLTIPAGQFSARSFHAAELPPEIHELVDRETQPGWLSELLKYPFLQRPGSVQQSTAQNEMIAVVGAATQLDDDIAFWLSELKSLIARHRSTLQEY